MLFRSVSTALVLLMTPALAFFYGGLARSKNALNTMMMSFISLGFVGALWAVIGYSLAFTAGNDWVGDLSNAFLYGVGLEAKGTIPHYLFMSYQGTFAIITAALISGAIVERMRFSAYIAFISLWSLVVYAPVAHWVWGGGWLAKLGALDFAGGTVVHVNAAVAALVAALVIGKRLGYGQNAMPPHNLTYTVIGAAMLWIGWFGFNAGSNLEANGVTALAPANALRGIRFVDGGQVQQVNFGNLTGSSLATEIATRLPGAGAALASGGTSSLTGISSLPPAVQGPVLEAFTAAVDRVFTVAAPVMALASISSLRSPRWPIRKTLPRTSLRPAPRERL